MDLFEALDFAARDVSERTATDRRHRVAAWIRWTGSSELPTPDSIATARTAGQKLGLSPTTIENTVREVLRVARAAGVIVPPGRALRRQIVCRPVPAIERVARVYRIAAQCQWPTRVRRDDWTWLDVAPELRADWLRALLVLGVWTGLRASDLLRLDWSSVGANRITWQASKTARQHVFPSCDVVEQHLRPLRRWGRPTVLGVRPTTLPYVRDELARLCGIAGVEPITPQSLRRCCVTTWATVAPEAGRIVHGTGLGVLAHYYDGEQILRSASHRFPWPVEMLPPDQRDERSRARAGLEQALARLSPERLADLARVATAFAG